MKKFFFILPVVVLGILSGCGTQITESSAFPAISVPTSTTPVPSNPLTVIKLAPDSFVAQAEYYAEPKTVAGWNSGDEEIIINGGYFNEDYTPSGYLVVDKKRIGKRIFDQDKSGIFGLQNNKVLIRDLKTDPLKTGEQFDFAVQSYPFLIEDGKPAIKTVSDKRARRTAVGVDKENNFYIIIVDQKELSLYEFMEELLKTDISFVQVLNLDGGPSTGLYEKWGTEEKVKDSIFPVPNIIRFIKK